MYCCYYYYFYLLITSQTPKKQQLLDFLLYQTLLALFLFPCILLYFIIISIKRWRNKPQTLCKAYHLRDNYNNSLTCSFFKLLIFKIITDSEKIAKTNKQKKYREVLCTHHLASPKCNSFYNYSAKTRELTLVQ